MRQYSLTPLPAGQNIFAQWVKDNLRALCDASQIDVISNVNASGAALSSLNNAVANDIPIWTDATDVTFLNLSDYFVNTLAPLNSAGAWLGALGGVPATLETLTGTSGTVATTGTIFNPSGTFTATLPSAAANTGKVLLLKTVANQAVNSASANVIPLAGGAAGTAILSNTAGKWAWLQSDGSNWNIMSAN